MRDDISPETITTTTPMGRRTLVRAGATAAWTVPVIAMAAPAHATSCSGGSTALSAVVVTGTKTQSGTPKLTVNVQVEVCNIGGSPSCDLYATAVGTSASTRLNALSVGGWPGAVTGGSGSSNLTVSAPADQQLGVGACTTYQVSYLLHDAAGTHTVRITFATGNGASASVNVTTTR